MTRHSRNRAVLYGPLVLCTTLVTGDIVADDDLSLQRAPWESCTYCHGSNGVINSDIVPSIGGQRAPYIAKQLADFRSGRRADRNRMMDAAVAFLDPADDARVAAHFAAQSGGLEGLLPPDTPVPAVHHRTAWRAAAADCVACHGHEHSMALHNAPRLRGQNRRYLEHQLNDFRSGRRNNDRHAAMRSVAGGLSKGEIEALAAFLATGDSAPSTSAD